MTITIDTANKTISILGNVPIGELINELSKLLPEEGWREFTLINTYYPSTDPIWAPPRFGTFTDPLPGLTSPTILPY